MLSRTYRERMGLIRMAYSAGLIALPRLAFAMRGQVRNSLDWLPPAPSRQPAAKQISTT